MFSHLNEFIMQELIQGENYPLSMTLTQSPRSEVIGEISWFACSMLGKSNLPKIHSYYQNYFEDIDNTTQLMLTLIIFCKELTLLFEPIKLH